MDNVIRVLSYNLRSGRRMSGELDIAGTVSVICRIAPDIAGLQEVRIWKDLPAGEGNMPVLLGEGTGMASFFGRTLDRETFEYGIGALSRFPAELVEVLFLPQPATSEQRAVIVLKITAAEKTFYLVNTHLVFERELDHVRADQMRAITALLKEKSYYPAILTGDFNATPGSPCLGVLKQENWQIADMTPLTFPADQPRHRIDYIAWYPAESFCLKDFCVVNEPAASDHRPVLAELMFAGNQG